MLEPRKPVNRLELSKIEIQKASIFAEKILTEKFPKIDERNFEDIFGPETVNAALRANIARQETFKKTNNNGATSESLARGKIFEAVFLDLGKIFGLKELI